MTHIVEIFTNIGETLLGKRHSPSVGPFRGDDGQDDAHHPPQDCEDDEGYCRSTHFPGFGTLFEVFSIREGDDAR